MMQVSGQGDILYAFRKDFKAVIRSRSLLLRLQPGLKTTSQLLALGGRIAFGAALVSSVALVYVSIMVLLTANSDDRDNRGSRWFSRGY